MSYKIEIGDRKYVGRTQPGSSDVRLYNSENAKYIATFIPRTNSENKVKSGIWEIGSYIDELEDINKIEPDIIKFCEQRRQVSQSASA